MEDPDTEGDTIFNHLISTLSKDAGFQLSSYCAKFGKLRTNLQRMNFVYGDMERHKAYPAFKEDEKSDSKSITLREEGNQHYKEGTCRRALDHYTMSIMNAKSKETVALAYANRSAVLFKLKLYDECLKDIDRAFENNYPDKLKAKLEERQRSAKTAKSIGIKHHEPIPRMHQSKKHPDIACAKDCIKLTKNEQYGRHVVATRDIDIGEIIAVEPSYCTIIKEEIYVHCHECFELCYNMVPCEKCTRALYCSKTCQDRAFDTYHKYECPIFLTLELVEVDFPKRLALRIALKSTNERDVNNSDQLGTEYRSDRFKEVSNLLGHAEKRSAENLLARTASACGFFHLLKNHTTFLQDHTNEDRLKEMLLSMVLISGINTVDVNEFTGILGLFGESPIATAIYSFHSMFNHSCWPNVSRHFYGSSMVLRAKNTISKGDQCFVCYGPLFSSKAKEFRQRLVSERQLFTCACRACEEDWPVEAHVDGRLGELRMSSMMNLGTGEVDGAKTEIRKLLIKAKKAERLLAPGQDIALKNLISLCYDCFGNKKRF